MTSNRGSERPAGWRSIYKDELRKALLFIEDIVTDDANASARAMGYLAGAEERLAARAELGAIRSRCRVCEQLVGINSAGRVLSHRPVYAFDAYGMKSGNYCRGGGSRGLIP